LTLGSKLTPFPTGKTLGDLPRLLVSLPSLSKKELADFSADVAMVRETAPKEGLKDPHRVLAMRHACHKLVKWRSDL
jgi:hypothetical protein